jgi:hypothetical protein
MRVDGLEAIVTESSGYKSTRILLAQLKEGSDFLEQQKDDLAHLWRGFTPRIVSFYEVVRTPTAQRVSNICSINCWILINIYDTVGIRWVCTRRTAGPNGR